MVKSAQGPTRARIRANEGETCSWIRPENRIPLRLRNSRCPRVTCAPVGVSLRMGTRNASAEAFRSISRRSRPCSSGRRRSSASIQRIQSPVAASSETLRAAEKSSRHACRSSRPRCARTISGVASDEPVSTATISSTAPRTLSRQPGSNCSSSRTIMHNESFLDADSGIRFLYPERSAISAKALALPPRRRAEARPFASALEIAQRLRHERALLRQRVAVPAARHGPLPRRQRFDRPAATAGRRRRADAAFHSPPTQECAARTWGSIGLFGERSRCSVPAPASPPALAASTPSLASRCSVANSSAAAAHSPSSASRSPSEYQAKTSSSQGRHSRRVSRASRPANR